MFGRIFNILRYPTHTRTLSILGLLIVISAIPLTVFIAQRQQEIRQRASAGVCRDNPVAPPDGYKWTALCSNPACGPNSDCPIGANNQEGWCYGFEGESKCLRLDQIETGGTGTCRDNPVAPPDGYKWTALCSNPACGPNSDCPIGANNQEGWCYGFEGESKCLRLDKLTTEGPGQCSLTNVPKAPTGYKWLPIEFCGVSCKDTTNHSDCPKNNNLPADLIDKSAWCYGYQNAQGQETPKCLQLRRVSTTATPTPQAGLQLTCSENTTLKTSTKLAIDLRFSGDKTGYDKIVCVKRGNPEPYIMGINDSTCVFKNLTPNTSYLLKAIATSSTGKQDVQCPGKTYTTLPGPSVTLTITPTPGGGFNTSPCYIQLTKPEIVTSAPLSPWKNNLSTLTWMEAAPNRAHGGFQWDKFWGKYQASRAGWNYAMAGVRVQGAQSKGTESDLDWFANEMFGIFGINSWAKLQEHERQNKCPFLEIKEACNGNGSTALGRCPSNASSQTCYVQPPVIDPAKPASFTCTPPGRIIPSITPTKTPTVTPTRTPTPSPTLTPTPTPIVFRIGDFDRDGDVDIFDFNLWRDEFLGRRITKDSDANKDGVVDIIDFNLWRDDFLDIR